MKLFATLMTAGILIGGLSAIGKLHETRALPEDTLREAVCDAKGRCEVLEVILVGTGCGPEKAVMVARQEDEFPFNCEAIEGRLVRPLDARGY